MLTVASLLIYCCGRLIRKCAIVRDGHPMKPARLALTHELVVNYGLHKKMNFISPREAFDFEVKKFHSDDYVDFLRR